LSDVSHIERIDLGEDEYPRVFMMIQFVPKYQVDATVLLTAMDRVAELADSLYEKVTTRPAVT
jgi:hypothetical protein